MVKFVIGMLLAGVCLVALQSNVFGQDPKTDLILKLNSRNYAEREKAARALEQLGEAAIPLLEKILASSELETRRRAGAILDRIEERTLFDGVLRATSVRLRVPNEPLVQALRTIEKQTGLRCVDPVDGDRLFRLDSGPLPYWQAWQNFCRAAKLEEEDYTRTAAQLKPLSVAAVNDLLEMLSRQDTFDLPHRYSLAPIKFAEGFTASGFASDDEHSIRVRVKWMEMKPAGGGMAAQALFALEVRAEPRLHIVAMPKIEITKVVAGDGREVLARRIRMLPEEFIRQEHADYLSACTGETQSGGLLHLRALTWDQPVAPLKEVHGTVRADVLVRPRMLEIKDVLKCVGKEVRNKQGITMKVLAAERSDDGDVRLHLNLDHLESLTPKTLAQQVVRVRPGVVVMKGAVDVAVERLELRDSRNMSVAPRESLHYPPSGGSKGYDVHLKFTTEEQEVESLTLSMTESPRVLSVVMPFVVRSVQPPKKVTQE